MAEFKQSIFYPQSEWDDDQKTIKAQLKEFVKKIKADNPGVKINSYGYKIIPGGVKVNIDNPIEDAGNKTAFRLESKEKQFYLKFGYLLEYIAKNILPKIKIGEIHDDNPSIFKIDYGDWTNHMYSLPNQISLDPKVCLVRNDQFNIGYANTQIFHTLSLFRESDNGESDASANAAYPMNIYLNFNFILECLAPNDRGDVNVFEFISSICIGLNKALGGINNLEPVINEETNTLQIIDTTPIPGYSNRLNTQPYTLQLYGYNNIGSNYISNFVRNINLKTVIDPGFATMITVGATAGGYVKGTEATAFSKWNFGLIDRYKEEFTPGNISSVKKPNEDDEAEANYVTEFITNGYISRYGITGLTENFNLNPDAIERNLSIVTEYYKYIIAKESIDQTTSGGTIGFIPFKLGITLDGISGIKIYNKLEVNTEFLPKAYGKTVDLIVTGVSHTLSNNDWETQIETTVIPKTGKQSVISIPQLKIKPSSIKKKGADIIPKDPNKLCGLANAKNVNEVYPKSVKWNNGKAKVIVTATKSPSVTINLKNVPKVAKINTTYTAKQVIEGAKVALNRMAPSASDKYKRLIITSALTVAIKEQSLKGFNNNLTGVEASGFKLFTKDEVVGKVILTEGQGTGKVKEYYAFKDLSSGLIPVISKILERNMFATGGAANEFAWRYFRDWNGYGGRTTEHYSLPSNQKSKAGVSGYDSDDCKIISGIESAYDKAAAYVKQYY